VVTFKNKASAKRAGAVPETVGIQEYGERGNILASQEGEDLTFEGRTIGKTLVDGDNVTLLVDNKCRRDDFDAVIGDYLLVTHQNRVVHRELKRERFNYTGTLLIKRDPNNNQASVLVFSLQCDKARNLLTAWRAPGSPEIQDQYFPFKICKTDQLSINIGKLPVRCRWVLFCRRRRIRS